MNKAIFCIGMLTATVLLGNPDHGSHHRGPHHNKHGNHHYDNHNHHPHKEHEKREKTEVIINVNDGKESADSSKIQFVPMLFNGMGLMGGVALALYGRTQNGNEALMAAGVAETLICAASGFTGAKVVSPATNSNMSFFNMLSTTAAGGIAVWNFISGGDVKWMVVAAGYAVVHGIDVAHRVMTDSSKK
jgi:hypothetical protein